MSIVGPQPSNAIAQHFAINKENVYNEIGMDNDNIFSEEGECSTDESSISLAKVNLDWVHDNG